MEQVTEQDKQILKAGIILGIELSVQAYAQLYVYVFRPKSGEITPNHVCVASNVQEAKRQFLEQLPSLAIDIGLTYKEDFYSLSKSDQLLMLELWLPDSDILAVPTKK